LTKRRRDEKAKKAKAVPGISSPPDFPFSSGITWEPQMTAAMPMGTLIKNIKRHPR
jgi:hypothetical protein